MALENNLQAYRFILEIEIGLREFLIDLIKKNSVPNWFESFLGENQRLAVKDFVKAVTEKIKKKEDLTIDEQYIYKLGRVKLTVNELRTLSHPFYYLNWPDIQMLLEMKANSDLLDRCISKPNRELLCLSLKNLNEIRNDIAHSRIINSDALKFLKTVYDQISVLIPEFSSYCTNQTLEHDTAWLNDKINKCVNSIINYDMISNVEIAEFEKIIVQAEQSFWLNSFSHDLIDSITKLKIQFFEYKRLRGLPGGLLKILQWKRKNILLLEEIKIIVDGKI